MPEVLDIETRSKSSSAHKKIALQDIIHYTVEKGLSPEEASKILGCSTRNIYNRLEPYKDTLKNHEFYKINRQEVFDIIEQELVFSFTPSDIKSASFRDRSVLFGILRDKANQNKNITVNYFSTTIQQAHTQVAQKVISQEPISVDK